ncbi:hypothetical protein [Qipengyuania sp.]|uniref:hypothetical protein n=1 Tax=Qipengyuania sp. TaxID=2004515 RepID=UPI0035C8031E
MISALLVLGLLDGGTSPGVLLDAPAERRIRLSRNAGFTVAGHVLDPYDKLNFEIDMSALLEEGERFASVDFAVTPASSILGFTIPDNGAYAPFDKDDSHLILWPQIDAGKIDAGTWSGQGRLCNFEMTMQTDSTPPRHWQRTIAISVAQR